jgi:hypothetical protein
MSITWSDPDAFTDFPSVDSKRETYEKFYKLPYVLCPQCHGYGGHNLTLNAHGVPRGMEDTAEVRHKYCHFKAFCGQCNGWGFVDANGPNVTCVHAMRHSRNVGKCLHVYTCRRCGYEQTIDSSD